MKHILIIAILTFTSNVFAQVSKTVTISAGNLSSALTTNEKNSITNLTIQGSIDARDFKTMRDDMPMLAEVDINSVNISEYIGIEGTASNESVTYPVNTIPDHAFHYIATNTGKINLSSIVLPPTIISIGSSAFDGCTGLTSITIPNSVNLIAYSAFWNCMGLTSVTIPANVNFIDNSVFAKCKADIIVDPANPNYSSLDGVLFDKTKTRIKYYPTTKSGEYIIPQSVEIIEQEAFNSCLGLTSVNIPSSVKSIDNYAFNNCTGLVSLNLPLSLTSVGQQAFYNCINLNGTLSIPAQTSSIGRYAFSYCTNLDEVNIPASVASIGNYAFYNCGGNISVDNNNIYYSSDNGILFDKAKKMLIQCPSSKQGSYTIPSSVTSIGPSAFSRCSLISGITIPSNVSTIGSSAFWGCMSLTGSITIPSTVKSIGNYAFSGCTGLTSVSIPSSINTIGISVFYNCSGLSSIYAYFENPIQLYNYENDEFVEFNAFYGVNKTTCRLYVPYGSSSNYKYSPEWQEFTNIIEMHGFNFSAESIKIESSQNSKAEVEVTADVSWKVSSDQSWLTVNPNSGTGNTKLTFTATANPTNSIRMAKITVSATGVESRTISVVQSYALQTNITKLFDFDCQNAFYLNYRSKLVFDGRYLFAIMTNASYEKSILIRIKPDGTELKELYSFDFNENTYLTLSDNVLFGTVQDYKNLNFIFRINTDGTNYSKLDLFNGLNLQLKKGVLAVSNNTIYGICTNTNSNKEALFKVNIDGTNYSTVYSSNNHNSGNVVISGNTLIVSTYSDNVGIFKINTNGTGYLDFGIPRVSELIENGNVIYGVAQDGSDGGSWNIFKVNLDGSGYSIMHTLKYFDSSSIGSLCISGNTLYCMSYDNKIFKINLNGTDFSQISTELRSTIPYYGITLADDALCGLSEEFSSNSFLFQLNLTNNLFSKVFKFGASTTGMQPIGSLIESENFLYGTTYAGGDFYSGILFRIKKDGSGFTKIFDFNGKESGAAPMGQLTMIGNMFYGTTSTGVDQTENGSIFKINIDGTGYTKLHDFDDENGSYPYGSLILHKGFLYGITSSGGIENHGVVFKIKTDGTEFQKISDNTDVDTGENPYNGIAISDDDVIYGITAIDYGGVFKVNTDGSGLKKIFEMNDESGDFSYCKPLLIGDELYFTTSERGSYGVGTISKINVDGTGFKVLYNFEGVDEYIEGSGFRNNSLTLHDGKLYGTATGNGINDDGYLFQINLDGTGFTKLSDFNGEFGSMPYLCDLIIDETNVIYGMTSLGGKYSGGIIYKYDLNNMSGTEAFKINDDHHFQVYPNPFTEGFRIKGVTEKTKIYLTDINGQSILTKELENDEFIDASHLSAGIYILRIESKTTHAIQKLIKK